jgi:hypothetical protein
MADTVKRTTSAKKKPAAPAATKKAASKRPAKKVAPKATVFTITKGGGIYYKIRQKSVLVFDEGQGYNREIRYARGERSIFVDEQSTTARRETIVFRDKNLLVNPNQPELLAYLRAHPDNVANGGRVFNEVNNQSTAEEDVENEFLVHDAIGLIRSAAIEELMPMVLSYGIDSTMSSMEIKKELLKFAKGNPKNFMELYDSPVVQIKADVLTAIDFQILLAKADGMYWGDNNALICPTPMGQNSVEVFTRFLMTDRGNSVRDELQRQIDSL